MGYQHRVITAKCPQCSDRVLWSWEELRRPGTDARRWDCHCGVTNSTKSLKSWPSVPAYLYVGHEKNIQLKVYPVPPDASKEDWAQPYSIRSFVSQASQYFGGCAYTVVRHGTVMDEPVFRDRCYDPDASWRDAEWCHLVGGWTRGEVTCPLWESIAKLCQTEAERKFLHMYFGLVKDRQFPMLIPQARLGIAERRRPDFVLFVPVHYWRYTWYAIQLDAAHPLEVSKADELRDADVALQGYTVLRLKPGSHGYYEEVRKLVERIEREMAAADADPWSVALQVPIHETEVQDEDVPF